MFGFSGKPSRLVNDKLSAETCPTISASEASRASTTTTQQQREAVAALIDHSNADIFTWLKLVRSACSIEPIPEHSPGAAHLSPSQIHALFALKHYPDDTLLGCLELARLRRNDLITKASARGLSIDPGPSNNLSSLLKQSDHSSIATKPWVDSIEENYPKTVIEPSGQQWAVDDFSEHHQVKLVDSTLSKHFENHYWCTVCENPNSYKDSGNWKKHEKGHETLFVCKLDDVVDDGWAGQNASTKQFSCKRRDLMVNHLNKSHGVSEAQQGRDLADTWRISVRKQAWSCGFCVTFFSDFLDRLKHIDIEHFRNYENIRDWDFNKVIHGLLLQPKMERAWKKRTAISLPWGHPKDLVWTEAFAKSMRTRLEIGPSNEKEANSLAGAVYSAGKIKNSGHEIPMMPATVAGSRMAGASSLSPPNPDRALTAQASGSGPGYQPRPSSMGDTACL